MIYPIAYQRTDRILLAKFRRICLEGEALEAIGVEAEAVCKYTASTFLLDILQAPLQTKLILINIVFQNSPQCVSKATTNTEAIKSGSLASSFSAKLKNELGES